MPIGTSVNEDARLVGYFFKLQGYISKQQQLEAGTDPEKARDLEGARDHRTADLDRLACREAEGNTPVWLLVTIGSVAVVFIVGWVLLAMRRSRRPALPAVLPSPGLDSEGPSVDNWLDQAQSGRLNLEPVPETTARSDGAALDGGFGDRLSGNIFRGNDESNNGHSANKGN